MKKKSFKSYMKWHDQMNKWAKMRDFRWQKIGF